MTQGDRAGPGEGKGATRACKWPTQRLKYAATINDEALAEDADPDYEIQYVDIGNVDSSGTVHEIVTHRLADAPSRARRRVRDGDVIVSCVRTYLQAIAPIPEHWKVVSNGRLFRERVELNRPELPILNVSIHTGVELREFSASRIEQQCYDRTLYKVAREGDLAYNTMRMWQGAVGVAPVDGLVSPAYVVCCPMAQAFAPYYELVFRTAYYRTEVNRYSYGIVPDRNRLYWERFKQMSSPLPPVREQRSIVQNVGERARSLVSLADKNREAINKLQEYRTALISAAVTGKIDVREEVAAP